MDVDFETEVEKALEVCRRGGVILYPTDTVWGLGCDATNPEAVQRIYTIKQRTDSKSLIILLADERDLIRHVAAPDPAVYEFWEQQERPTTIIFEHALGLADNVIAADGSVAIRLVQDAFCRHLITRLRKPIVSTSANISGHDAPKIFTDISEQIKNEVDYVVRWRQTDHEPVFPSKIVRWLGNGEVEVIRP
jgi:L-threonylcarbamoyladenylate synthase